MKPQLVQTSRSRLSPWGIRRTKEGSAIGREWPSDSALASSHADVDERAARHDARELRRRGVSRGLRLGPRGLRRGGGRPGLGLLRLLDFRPRDRAGPGKLGIRADLHAPLIARRALNTA